MNNVKITDYFDEEPSRYPYIEEENDRLFGNSNKVALVFGQIDSDGLSEKNLSSYFDQPDTTSTSSSRSSSRSNDDINFDEDGGFPLKETRFAIFLETWGNYILSLPSRIARFIESFFGGSNPMQTAAIIDF